MKSKLFLFALFISSFSCAQTKLSGTKAERMMLAATMEKSIRTALLNKWYPQAVDTQYGGFKSTFTFDFKPTGPQDKFIVTQARHTWSTATAAQLYPGVSYYIDCSEKGYRFLRDVMWDKRYGGFYNLVDRQGNVKTNNKAAKEAYGNAFAIYALSAYFKASGDTNGLNLAKSAFLWLEKGSHDPVYKGYYQHLERDGTPVKRTAMVPSTSDLGYKDQNSSIHLLEAFTALYEVWPDALVRERLLEMLLLIRDTITTNTGYLTLFFKPDWTPVSFRDSSETSILKHKNLDHVSSGHDVETAYLMLEASHALGLKGDTQTMITGKRMVDHALHNGWDSAAGGFYDAGYYFKGHPKIKIIQESKNWWAQAEGLNTLLLMADHFPQDSMHYYERFKQLWSYVQTYLIDPVHGGWFEEGLDKEPERKTALKGHIWKEPYHQFRALSNCVIRLRTLPRSH